LLQRVADARKQFKSWAAGQNVVTAKSRWTNFGADKPGVVPAGTDGSERDVVVYENAVALLQDGDQPKQLLVGTIIQVGDAWRLIDLPKAISEGSVVSDGVFFSASFNPAASTPTVNEATGGISPATQRLINELQEIDSKLAAASGDTARLQASRADVLEKLVSASASDEDRTTWIKQFADTVSAAAQTGEYPGGVQRLQDFARKLSTIEASDEELSYVVFRTLSADFNTEMQKPKAKYEELQKAYLANLEKFVRKYPESDDAAEAMLQIGLSSEFAGETKNAEEWYAKASRGFRGTPAGRKAAGALRRLNLEGKPFQLKAARIDGGSFDSTAYLGGPVIYHGWATWCEACKAEMRALKQLQGKYAKDKLRIVGLNFDNSAKEGIDFLKKEAFPWVHLFDEGGLESELAISNGLLSLPANIVVDGRGRVVASGVHWTELDGVIGDLVK
jgi:thiol-disulfide isomerase/thioredoxin